jgi:hypothetical protein
VRRFVVFSVGLMELGFRADAAGSFETEEVYTLDGAVWEFALLSGALWRSGRVVSGFL